jgi:hypothetical protein
MPYDQTSPMTEHFINIFLILSSFWVIENVMGALTWAFNSSFNSRGKGVIVEEQEEK